MLPLHHDGFSDARGMAIEVFELIVVQGGFPVL